MINSIATTQTVAPNTNVLFAADRVRTTNCKGCSSWLCHDTASGIYTITKPGFYEISYSATLTPVTGAPAVSLAIKKNGEIITGSNSIYTPSAAGTYGTLTNFTVVQVCKGSTDITIANSSNESINLFQGQVLIKKVL